MPTTHPTSDLPFYSVVYETHCWKFEHYVISLRDTAKKKKMSELWSTQILVIFIHFQFYIKESQKCRNCTNKKYKTLTWLSLVGLQVSKIKLIIQQNKMEKINPKKSEIKRNKRTKCVASWWLNIQRITVPNSFKTVIWW